jgi:hypothetical protein
VERGKIEEEQRSGEKRGRTRKKEKKEEGERKQIITNNYKYTH